MLESDLKKNLCVPEFTRFVFVTTADVFEFDALTCTFYYLHRIIVAPPTVRKNSEFYFGCHVSDSINLISVSTRYRIESFSVCKAIIIYRRRSCSKNRGHRIVLITICVLFVVLVAILWDKMHPKSRPLTAEFVIRSNLNPPSNGVRKKSNAVITYVCNGPLTVNEYCTRTIRSENQKMHLLCCKNNPMQTQNLFIYNATAIFHHT